MGFLTNLWRGRQKVYSLMSPTEAEKIIQQYGVFLETQAPTPGCVADVSKLPFPKEQIKKALIVTLVMTKEQQMKEILKQGYVMLADWQEGVGENNQGLDLLNMDLNVESEKLLQLASDQMFEEHHKWQPIVEAEREKLRQELKSIGLW